jgi:pilus assembly protein CpaB
MRRPAIFFLLAGVAAVLASMVVYSSLKKKDEEVAKALAVTVPIVVAAKDIPVGAKIDAGAIKLVRWPRNGMPPAAITEASSVIGSVARSEFVENEPIVASRLVAGDKTSGVLPLMLPNDMRAMSVAVDEVSDMSGFILPYTRVDVLFSLTSGDKDAGRSRIILQNIPVLAVAQTVERKDNPEPERVVTLEVTPEQAEVLAVASTQGKLHLALRSYGDNAFVATSGSDVSKVMGESSEVPAPVPVEQSVPVRVPVRRIFHRPRPLQRVEVLRNGASRETVIIGRDGRAAAGGAPGASADGSVPSAYVASLGTSEDSSDSGTGDYGPGGSSSGTGMTGAGAGVSAGGY